MRLGTSKSMGILRAPGGDNIKETVEVIKATKLNVISTLVLLILFLSARINSFVP